MSDSALQRGALRRPQSGHGCARSCSCGGRLGLCPGSMAARGKGRPAVLRHCSGAFAFLQQQALGWGLVLAWCLPLGGGLGQSHVRRGQGGLCGMRSAWDELEEGHLVHHIWWWSGAQLCCRACSQLSTSDEIWLLWGRGRAVGLVRAQHWQLGARAAGRAGGAGGIAA